MAEQNKEILSGEELKKLMTDGVLPDEYVNEKNLNVLFDYEVEQMGDNEYYDTSIMRYCADLIAENYTDENYEKRKQETFEKVKAQIEADEKRKKAAISSVRRIAIACIICLISVQVISGTAFGVNLFSWTKDKFLALVGIEKDQNNITYATGHLREFKTLEEFQKSENIKIIIPTWLPGNLTIENISYAYDYDEGRIDIFYNDDMVLLTIKLNSFILDIKGAEIHENNDVLYYIFKDANVIYWEHDGNSYNLISRLDISEYTEKIIENIK